MHSFRLYTSRRLALLLLIGIPVITLVSVGHILKRGPNGLRVLKRDGSTITFTLPWKSVITPAAPNVKISSPAANNYLDGITNVAEALTQGGILVGESGAGDGSDSLSIVIKGVDGSLTNVQKNPINTAVGQGELVNAGTSLVGQALSTATSPSNVGALNTTKPTAGSVESHSDGCGCSICGCAHSTPAPSLANSPSGKANITSPPILRPTGSTMAMPMTSCGGAPTVTETWHSTHYAETATMFSFMSIMTVTCTETISLCPSSPYLAPNNMTVPPSTGLIQCMNGVFVQRKEECPTTMMNNSTFPGSQTNPCYPCSECSTGLFCPPQTPAQPCPCGTGWPCADCNGGWFCPPSSISGLPSSNSSTSLPSMIASSMTGNITASPTLNVTSLTQSTPSINGTLLASGGITSSFAQPTLLRNTTAFVSNGTSSLAQQTLSPNVTIPNTTSSPILPTLLPNSTLFPSNGSTIGNVTSLPRPEASPLPTLNGTIELFSSSSSFLATNTSVLLPTRVMLSESPSLAIPMTTPLISSLTGSLGPPLLPTNSALLGSIPLVSLPLTTSALLTSAPLIPSNLPPNQVTPVPINVSDYGSRVLQGVESDVKGALSNIDGLTGSLLSTVLAEVNSVLAVALQTAAPIPNRVDAVLPSLPSPALSNVVASVLPAVSQAINNAVDAGGVPATSSPLSVANGILGSLLPAASPIINNVVVNVPGAAAAVVSPAAVGAMGNALPVVSPLGSNVVGIAGGLLAANGFPRILPA